MSAVQTKEAVIALLGQPNSGKSTLFKRPDRPAAARGQLARQGRWSRKRATSPAAA